MRDDLFQQRIEAGFGPSSSITSTAAASRGTPRAKAASTASRMPRSISSSAAGTMPAAMIWLTACEASSIEANVARIVRQACGSFVSRAQILVTIASVPSLPQTMRARSSAAGSSTGPNCTIEPSPSTTSSPATWLTVTPYFSVCGPPALVATLPPMVAVPWLDGSGAKWQPVPARAG